jgi:hypothetical protein
MSFDFTKIERGEEPSSKAYNSPDNQRSRRLMQELAIQTRQAIDTTELCQCVDCAMERMQKQMTLCEMNERLMKLLSKIVRPMPGNFMPDLSPNPMYWPLGRGRG